MKFNEFNLSAELLAEIEKAGFVEASPIQEQTIPLALEGKDVIGQAQTGTGTVSYTHLEKSALLFTSLYSSAISWLRMSS